MYVFPAVRLVDPEAFPSAKGVVVVGMLRRGTTVGFSCATAIDGKEPEVDWYEEAILSM